MLAGSHRWWVGGVAICLMTSGAGVAQAGTPVPVSGRGSAPSATAAARQAVPPRVRRRLNSVNRPPVAVAAVTPTTGPPSSSFVFSARGSFDPDGTITSYAWQFGDGFAAAGVSVNHPYSASGAYHVVLTVTDDDGATATASLCVPVGPGFAARLNVSQSPQSIETQPAVALDRSGKVHIAYISVYYQAGAPDNVASDILYTNNVGGPFSTPVKLSVPSGYYSNTPDLAVDGAGAAHIFFRRSENQTAVLSDDDLCYATNRTGVFETKVAVDGSYGEGRLSAPTAPDVEVDSGSTVHMTFVAHPFSNPEAVYYMNFRGGQASTPPVAAVAMDAIFGHSMALDRDGWPHIAVFGSPTTFAEMQLFYTKAVTNPLGVPQFAAPVNVSNVPRPVNDFYPAVGVDNDGFAHVAYRDPFVLPAGSPQLYYVTNRSGSFDGRIAVPGTFAPSMVLDAKGFVHIASKTCCFAVCYTSNVGGTFTDTLAAPMTSLGFWARHHLAIGADGSVHLVYSDAGTAENDYEIYYVSGTTPTCPP